ncbi:hypothetical protein D3C84_647230 [compost metagenome]
MPARNAPRAGDKPSRWVSHAVSNTITRASSTNSSADRDAATSWNSRGNSSRLASSRPPNNTRVLPRVKGSAQYHGCSLLPANTGTRVNNSTATTSWNNNTPMAFWPWLLKISPRLVNSLLTMAVEDKASPAPSNNAAIAGAPSMASNPARTAPEHSTCRLPRPNTTRRSSSIFDRENSNPSENSRNTTPSSARSGSSSLSLTQSSAVGPTASPTQR